MWESTVSSLSNWMDGGIIHTTIETGGQSRLEDYKAIITFLIH